jgi:hypothetical protein
MANFLDAVVANPEVKFFCVLDSESEDPREWVLKPLRAELLSSAESHGHHVIKSLQVLPDGTVRKCYMNMSLPERISDYAFFVEERLLCFGHHHQFPGKIIPADAIDCFGVYEQFYVKSQPQLGIEILKRGLTASRRKVYIAQDLGYIFRVERRYEEAIEMFKVAIDEGPSSSFIYAEVAAAYGDLGDAENETNYRLMYKQAAAEEAARHAQTHPRPGSSSQRVQQMSRTRRWFQSLFRKSRADEPGWPVADTHKGKALAEILKDCGTPTKDLAGYYFYASEQPAAELPKGIPQAPHRTLVFERPLGTLNVWMHQVADAWVCFQSFWLPDGWVR